MNTIPMMTTGLLTLQGLLVGAGAIATLRDPARVASLYSGAVTTTESGGGPDSRSGPVIALFMAPLQVVIAILMLHTGYAIAVDSTDVTRRYVALMLGAFAVMELLFVAVRLRAGVILGQNSSRSTVVGRRGLVTSAVLCVLYGGSSLSLLLAS